MGGTSPLGDDLLARMLGMKLRGGSWGHDPRWLRKRCNAMVQEASLEGLGVLTVCVRLAGDAGYDRLAASLFWSVKINLDVLGPFLLAHGIAPRLAEYYESVLLPDCGQDCNLVNFDSCSFLYTLSALCRMLQAKAEAKNMESLEHDEAIAEILSVLDKSYDPHLYLR